MTPTNRDSWGSALTLQRVDQGPGLLAGDARIIDCIVGSVLTLEHEPVQRLSAGSERPRQASPFPARRGIAADTGCVDENVILEILGRSVIAPHLDGLERKRRLVGMTHHQPVAEELGGKLLGGADGPAAARARRGVRNASSADMTVLYGITS